jgi:cysteine desulfurase
VKRLYLDHNATCPLRPAARDELARLLSGPALGNPSSPHAEGRRARALLEEARERLARALDCQRDELVFTSGGTESNVAALLSAPPGRLLLYSPTDHPSVVETARSRGHEVALAVDGQGRVEPESLLRHHDERPALVSVGLANHETGTIQDLPTILRCAREMGARVHSDASQAFGKWPLSFRQLDLDLMTVSAHKLGGPVGVGALVVRGGQDLGRLLHGGEQEGGLRPGTEAVLLAAAFAAAAEEALNELPDALPMWGGWTQRLLEAIRREVPAVQLNTPAGEVLPNTLNASIPGRPGARLVQRLDLEGVSLSHGSACASGSSQPSAVLLAMGFDASRAGCAIRLSVGRANSNADIDAFPARLKRALADVAPRVTA